MKEWLSFLNLLVSFTAVGTLIWFHGVHVHSGPSHLWILGSCFGFYFVHFVVRARRQGWWGYLSRRRLETALIIGMLVAVALWLAGIPVARSAGVALGMGEDAGLLLVHIALLLFAGLELLQALGRSTVWRLSPPTLLLLSFAVMILVGASLLLLPEMTIEPIGFVDALFTSTSACCVTGLVVLDTASAFTTKGQLLILVLIEAGGLNIILFATFFILGYESVPTAPHEDAGVRELLGAEELSEEATRSLFGRIALTALPLQALGALALYLASDTPAFHAVFHAISAFNNAGFDIRDSFESSSPATLAIIGTLVVIGGIGFPTLWAVARHLRCRCGLGRGPRIALISAGTLLVVGTGALLLTGMSAGHAIFHSVSARTAGFSTVDLASASAPSLALLMLLMFVGASSGSTGGGIKTSTVAVLLARRRFSRSLVSKATTIAVFAAAIVVLATGLLIAVEPGQSWLALAFESGSAFGTVGLSTGLTPELSGGGKATLMITMLAGRLGPLALGYVLFRRIPEGGELAVG